MGKVVSPITVKVEHIGAVKDGEYGQYRPVLFVGDNEQKIWKSFAADSEELTLLSKGARVQLVPAGKTAKGQDKHNIVLLDTPQSQLRTQPQPKSQPSSQSQPDQAWSPERKRAIAIQVEQSCGLLRFCYETAQAKFAGLVDDPAELRAIATTLFIQALK